MRTTPIICRLFVPLLLMAVFAIPTLARTPHNFVPLSLSYAFPSGGLSDSTGAKPALGFSLGYRFEANKHLRLGARGTWMRLSLGKVDTVDFSDYGLTHVGMLLGAQYRFFKHGFTPYVDAEGGMGLLFADELIGNVPRKIDGLSEAKFSVAASAGVLIPLSDDVDVDLSVRYQTTFVENSFTTVAAHVGVVYALP